MNDQEEKLLPGHLWTNIRQSTQTALASNALLPIATRQIVLPDGGVDFLVRVVSSLAHKHSHHGIRPSAAPAHADDPFIPYEPNLYVGHVAPHHICLLNKFNVIENHVLVVTEGFEHQDNLLTEMDFEAWARCLCEFNSLGFYNGGKIAGASQTHKHMQLIPLPLSEISPQFPFFGLLQAAKTQFSRNDEESITVAKCRFPFKHAVVALDARRWRDTQLMPVYLFECYKRLLSAVGIEGVRVNGELRHSVPYNLLICKQWMWMVPRTREYYQDISVNALGFAGSLFVRDTAQLELVRNVGPMAVLRSVSAA
jgi:ATP adenylyltransferase